MINLILMATFAILFVLKVAGLAGATWGLASLSWFWVLLPAGLAFILFFIFLLIVAFVD